MNVFIAIILLTSRCTAQVESSSSIGDSARNADRKINVEMKSLGRARPNIIRRTALCHPSGQIAYVRSKGDKLCVVVGDRESAEFDDVGSGTLQFSEDGRHFAFAARTGRQWNYYVDMRPGPDFDTVASRFCFGPHGTTFAYPAKRGDKWFVVRETGESEPFQQVEAESFNFSSDGNHFAYRANTGHDFVVVLDGKTQHHYAVPTAGRPVFSPDSRHLAYGAAGPNGEYVVYDGIVGPTFDGVGLDGIAISAQGELAYAAQSGAKCRIMLGDDPCHGDYESISAPRFSGDGNHLTYFGRVGGKWHVVMDGTQGEAFDEVDFTSLQYSRDGLHIAFAAGRHGRWTVVVDNSSHRYYDAIGAGSIELSNRAKHIAFAAMKHDMWYVVRGLVEGAPHESIAVAPAMSADGKCVAYVARDGKSCQLIVNEEIGTRVDSIIPGSAIRFTSPRRIEGLVGVKSDEFFAISATIPEDLAQ